MRELYYEAMTELETELGREPTEDEITERLAQKCAKETDRLYEQYTQSYQADQSNRTGRGSDLGRQDDRLVRQ